jgi:glycerol kinase
MQSQADLLGIPVLRSAQTEATALGVAYLAGLAVGLLSEAEVAGRWQAGRLFEPAAEVERERRMADWHAAVAAVRGFGDRSG